MANFDDLLNNTPAEEQPQLSKEDYAAKKQAEREDLFALSDSTALEVAGDSGRFQQYLDTQSVFGRYSTVNTLLIMAQNPEATRLGNFDYWKSQGGFIKPGRTAISILEPHEYTKEDGTAGTGYNVRKVFDISQVDTHKMKAAPPAPSYSERQLLQALISKAPMKISGVDRLSNDMGAYTDPDSGEMFVRRGMAFADTFRSVAQELCYAVVEQADDNTVDTTFTAYSAAYILCKKHGVDTQDFHFAGAPEMFRGFEAASVKQELVAIRGAADTPSVPCRTSAVRGVFV